jgi:hypothetical protein
MMNRCDGRITFTSVDISVGLFINLFTSVDISFGLFINLFTSVDISFG